MRGLLAVPMNLVNTMEKKKKKYLNFGPRLVWQKAPMVVCSSFLFRWSWTEVCGYGSQIFGQASFGSCAPHPHDLTLTLLLAPPLVSLSSPGSNLAPTPPHPTNPLLFQSPDHSCRDSQNVDKSHVSFVFLTPPLLLFPSFFLRDRGWVNNYGRLIDSFFKMTSNLPLSLNWRPICLVLQIYSQFASFFKCTIKCPLCRALIIDSL